MSDSENKAKEKKTDNMIISLILSFVLSVFFLITSATFIINGFILSETSVVASLSEVDYHVGVYELIRDSVGDTLLPTQLPQEIIDDAITPEAVYADLNEYVSYMFANDLASLNLERDLTVEILNDNIDYFLLSLGLTQSDVGYEVIAEVVDAIIADYNHYIGTPFLSYVTRVGNLFHGHLRQLVIAGIAGILITSGIIFLISRRNKHLIFRYFAFSFGAAALMLIVAPMALRIWGVHHRLGIGPEFVYNFIVTHIERSITSFFLAGLGFIAFYFIFIFISAKLQKMVTSVT